MWTIALTEVAYFLILLSSTSNFLGSLATVD